MLNSELKSKIKTAKKVVILSHRSPDGDSIGSSLAIYHYLKNYIEAKFLQVITPDAAPKFLSWLDGFSEILAYDNNKNKCEKLMKESDLIFCLDFNTPSRMGEMAEIFNLNEKAFVINIDHHQFPENFADFQISDPSASSTCQLVYDFIVNLDDKKLVNKSLAEAIFTGIITDTGGFRYTSTSKHTHEIAATLIENGVQSSTIYSAIYDSYSLDRLKLLGFALNERFKVYPEFSTGVIYLTEEDLNQFNFQKGDTEGLVNYPLSVETIKMAILLIEKDKKVKMSFRSKGNFKVNEIASKYFSGGGHFNAAGGISELNVEDTLQKLESILPVYKDRVNE